VQLLPRWVADPPGSRVLTIFGLGNVAGAVVVFAYLTMTGQSSVGEVQEDAFRGGVLLGIYLAASGLTGALVGGRQVFALNWWYERRAPTPRERLMTLELPGRFALLSLVAWFGGVVLFCAAGLAVGDDGGDVVRTGVGIFLGGCTTSAMCALLIDRELRPVFAQVLANERELPRIALGVRRRIILAWALGSGVPLLGIVIAPIKPQESLTDLAILAGIGLVSGALLLGVATRSVSDRLASVRHALGQIQAGDLSVQVPVDEAGEIGTLQAGLNAMVRGLRERQVLADLFGRHVGEDVARIALEEGVHLGGEQRDVSVLFVDVTGSTWLAATREPTEVVALLNGLFSVVVRIVGEEGGWVDKFEGDAALCVFGAPGPLDGHPTAALRAARRLRESVGVEVGIGVSSGTVVAGNIGAEDRFEYTVIGDPVNEAARLTEEAKGRESRVLASSHAVESAVEAERAHWTPADTIPLRGRPEPTRTFEPRLSTRVVPSAT
jgi:adenylate cyclase